MKKLILASLMMFSVTAAYADTIKMSDGSVYQVQNVKKEVGEGEIGYSGTLFIKGKGKFEVSVVCKLQDSGIKVSDENYLIVDGDQLKVNSELTLRFHRKYCGF